MAQTDVERAASETFTPMEKIVSLCKRRGFVYPNSEIYGGVAGFYDFGPLGVEMRTNLRRHWWKFMVQMRDDVLGIEGAIITHPRVWEASGHVEHFSDPLADCKNCKMRFREDHLPDENRIQRKCPNCGGELMAARPFNLLMETYLGVVEGDRTKTYLRGEACQNIYLDYENVLKSSRAKIPFGICQIGEAFRNEVTPGNFLFRQREFTQWDLQYFVPANPSEMEKWFEYWKGERWRFYNQLIHHKDRIHFREHRPDELAHYAKKAVDIEYHTILGWQEWEGIHWRQDWDLSRHSQYSGQDLSYTDPETNEKYIPWIVETSGGLDRTFLYLLLDAYEEEPDGDEIRTVLHLHPVIAPVKVAVFPLLKNKPPLVEVAREIHRKLKPHFVSQYDEVGAIGRRYRRQDEIGTPFCVTVDFQTLDDRTVTLRERDSMQQTRVAIDDLVHLINDGLMVEY